MLPLLPSLILSPRRNTSFIIHFTCKCGQSLLFEKLFLAYSLIAPRIDYVCVLSERFVIHASLMKISNRVALDTAFHYR